MSEEKEHQEICEETGGMAQASILRCMIASKNTEKRGTGLGSKVAKDVVDAHKGKIEMDHTRKAHQSSLLD